MGRMIAFLADIAARIDGSEILDMISYVPSQKAYQLRTLYGVSARTIP